MIRGEGSILVIRFFIFLALLLTLSTHPTHAAYTDRATTQSAVPACGAILPELITAPGKTVDYNYANVSPVMYIDPWGLMADDCMINRNNMALGCNKLEGGGGGGAARGTIRAGDVAKAAMSSIFGSTGILNNDTDDEAQVKAPAPPKADDQCPVPGTTIEDKTSTGTEIRNKPGDFDEANKDFDDLSLTGVKPLRNNPKGRVGTLPDGRKVVVRPNSDDGRPTIEIQSKPKIKIRYGEKDNQ